MVMPYDSPLTAVDGVSLVRALMTMSSALTKLTTSLPVEERAAVMADLRMVGTLVDTLIASLEAKSQKP